MNQPLPRPSPRDLGVPFIGTPGPANCIVDVPGVEVGHCTVVKTPSESPTGRAVQTGVTLVYPRGREGLRPSTAAVTSLNGTGELTGSHLVNELGILLGPIGFTNTNSVGIVRDTVARSIIAAGADAVLPMVGEVFDGVLSDINGFHITTDHVMAAIADASAEPNREGVIGAGSGSIAFSQKGGIGTASRVVGDYTIGALTQTNMAGLPQLRVGGLLVGPHLGAPPEIPAMLSSKITCVVTDAPLTTVQANRVVRRAPLGMALTGASAGLWSGDLFVAAATGPADGVDDETLAALFEATVQVVEEAILSSVFRADSVTAGDFTIPGLDVDRVLELLEQHRLLQT